MAIDPKQQYNIILDPDDANPDTVKQKLQEILARNGTGEIFPLGGIMKNVITVSGMNEEVIEEIERISGVRSVVLPTTTATKPGPLPGRGPV